MVEVVETPPPHETDLFYSDPETMALKLLDDYDHGYESGGGGGSGGGGYTHVAMFSDMANRLQPLLERKGFSFAPAAAAANATDSSGGGGGGGGGAVRFFHAHIIDDDRASGEIVLVSNLAALEEAKTKAKAKAAKKNIIIMR